MKTTAATKKPFAKKSFGQNFLTDLNYIRKIIGALDIHSGDVIVEIGAGRGALTEKLIAAGARVIAIELDRDLIPQLNEKFDAFENYHLIDADALSVNFSQLAHDQKVKLVANLPYYISTAILEKLIDHREAFSEMVLMFQREVVTRMTAKPGNSERGFLTVLIEAYFEIEKLFDVPPSGFSPQPKIWSAVVRLKPKKMSKINHKLFRKILSLGFTHKRKTILNNLKGEYADAAQILQKSDIDPKRRAESLKLDEWRRIADILN